AGEGSRPGGAVATARLDLGAEPWLADHALGQAPIAPGALVAELCLAAVREPLALAELSLEVPLELGDDAVELQLALEAPDEGGERGFVLHGRAGAEGWRRFASGALGPALPPPRADAAVWPPEGAEQLDVEALYSDMLARGLAYGPAFQCIRRGFRTRDGEVVAEVELPSDQAVAAERYLLHPALLDGCLQAIFWAAAEPDEPLLPVAIAGLAVHRAGATALRVRVREVDDGSDAYSLDGFTPDGEPAFTLERVTLRPLEVTPAVQGELLRTEWRPLADEAGAAEPAETLAVVDEVPGAHADLGELLRAGGEGDEAPSAVVWRVAANAASPGRLCEQGLDLVKRFLAADELTGARLVVATRGAVAVHAGEMPDVAHAALAGLMRSARSEHPGRIALVDLDPAGGDDLAAVVRATRVRDELAGRAGEVFEPRLAPAVDGLVPPEAGAWRLARGEDGTLAGLSLVPCPEAERPLEPGEVRIAMRAAGINFLDVLKVLDHLPESARARHDPDEIGSEGAGVVLECGPGVERPAPGERVMGAIPGAFATQAITPADALVA
ncbi:MAG TPA: polyketide synthase dehydratase domain-containing protein, partial [Thermoleophilaceae bacterium]